MKKLLFVTILALVTVAALSCAPAPTQSPQTAAPKPTEVPVAKPTSAPTASPKPT